MNDDKTEHIKGIGNTGGNKGDERKKIRVVFERDVALVSQLLVSSEGARLCTPLMRRLETNGPVVCLAPCGVLRNYCAPICCLRYSSPLSSLPLLSLKSSKTADQFNCH